MIIYLLGFSTYRSPDEACGIRDKWQPKPGFRKLQPGYSSVMMIKLFGIDAGG